MMLEVEASAWLTWTRGSLLIPIFTVLPRSFVPSVRSAFVLS